jgi:hypothetical protein
VSGLEWALAIFTTVAFVSVALLEILDRRDTRGQGRRHQRQDREQ